MEQIQQGDVYFIPESIPTDVINEKTTIVQHGEATGHAHRLEGDATLYTHEPTKTRYLRVISPTKLLHEEHKPFEIPPGEYRIGIVREADHMSGVVRQVVD